MSMCFYNVGIQNNEVIGHHRADEATCECGGTHPARRVGQSCHVWRAIARALRGLYRSAALEQLHGLFPLAKFFLKYPPAALNSLLAASEEYMDSDEYRQQRARSDRRNESADVINQQCGLKHRRAAAAPAAAFTAGTSRSSKQTPTHT